VRVRRIALAVLVLAAIAVTPSGLAGAEPSRARVAVDRARVAVDRAGKARPRAAVRKPAVHARVFETAYPAGVERAASRRPEPPRNRLSLETAYEIGLMSTTHATVAAAYARRIWGDRAYVEARVGAGGWDHIVLHEERIGAGLIFDPSRRVDILVGWRIGRSSFRKYYGEAKLDVDALAVELAVKIAIAVAPRWELVMTPAAPTAFWDRTFGGAMGLEIGLAHGF
jgi:hypothetical protein